MRYFFILGFLVFSMNSFSQGLTITNGIKEKTFKEGSVYDIFLAKEDYPIDGSKPKNWSQLTGKIYQTSRDSFSMILSTYVNNRTIDFVDVKDIITSEVRKNYGVFPQSDLVSIKHYKSYKSKKRKKNWNTVGGLLIFTGLVTTVNAFLVPENRGNFFISGGSQIGLGIGLLIATRTESFNFRCGNDPLWEIKH